MRTPGLLKVTRLLGVTGWRNKLGRESLDVVELSLLVKICFFVITTTTTGEIILKYKRMFVGPESAKRNP